MGFRFLFRGMWWCGLALGALGALRGADDGDAAKFPQPEVWQMAGIRAAMADASPQPAGDSMPAQGLSVAEQQAVLGMLLRLWPASAAHSALRQEMAGRIGDVAGGITAAPDPKVAELLTKLDAELKADAVKDSQEAAAKARAAVQRALAGKAKAGH